MFKKKKAYEMRISDWSSDVCSSDLPLQPQGGRVRNRRMNVKNLKVNGDRLWDSLMEMAKIGPGVAGGNCRLALSDFDREGRDLFVRWCKEAGCAIAVDRDRKSTRLNSSH